jgi:8-oxo-dGTP diphosphatase
MRYPTLFGIEDLEESPITVVRVILQNLEKKVLILRRRSEDSFGGLWELPGGKLTIGESVVEGCSRELKEESQIFIPDFYGPILMRDPTSDGLRSLWTVEWYYSAECGTVPVVLSKNHDLFEWIGRGEIQKYQFAFGIDRKLEQFFNGDILPRHHNIYCPDAHNE